MRIGIKEMATVRATQATSVDEHRKWSRIASSPMGLTVNKNNLNALRECQGK